MKNLLTLAAAAGLAAPIVSQTAPLPEPCQHFETKFSVVIHAPYAEIAPLFGPLGERAWVGDFWKPKFIYPQPPKDVQGAVFTVGEGGEMTVWANTLFDLDARHMHYIHFLPGLEVATIDLRFTSIDEQTTQVDVIFTRTALTPAGNEHATRLSNEDQKRGEMWRQAIGNYLAGIKSGQSH